MPHRDPQTGQFVSGSESFDDVEVASFSANIGVAASNLSGSVGYTGGDAYTFDGTEILDFDEFVDRNEELQLLSANHHLSVYANSTGTEDGTVRAQVEVSTAASRQFIGAIVDEAVEGDAANAVRGDPEQTDTIDLIGRPLKAIGHQPFSDSASTVSGGGSAGDDSVEVDDPPAEMGRFHPRDEMYLNGRVEAWNIADAGVHLEVEGQHVYGVRSR